MADVSHELGSLRFVVESPLSSKVAMFNNQASQHKQSQLLNPFSNADGGRVSPKPTFSKDQYGKPLAGSLTEMRGQKANIHVMKEMIELCQIIASEGYIVKDEPTMRVIPFGELFNIYNYISDKVVGILLRARKYKLVEFEGEMLFQRRDDDVPVFLLKPIAEIRQELEVKIDEIKRASSPAPPQATSVLLDKAAHEQKLEDAGLAVPKAKSRSKSRSPSPSPSNKSKASTPTPQAAEVTPEVTVQSLAAVAEKVKTENIEAQVEVKKPTKSESAVVTETKPIVEANVPVEAPQVLQSQVESAATPIEPVQAAQEPPELPSINNNISLDEIKADINNNNNNTNDLPTIVVEASAVHDQGCTVITDPTVTEEPAVVPVVSMENAVV